MIFTIVEYYFDLSIGKMEFFGKFSEILFDRYCVFTHFLIDAPVNTTAT